MRKKVSYLFFIFVLLFSCLELCAKELIGAGASFPYVLYSKMFSEYSAQKGIKVNYQSIGSGGGIRSMLSKSVDFGATDAFMSDLKLKDCDSEIIHIPMCLGCVVLTYNLPGNPHLNFTSGIIQGIFMGEIKKWDDWKIKAVNPEIDLPSMPIITVHRSDSSGTSFIFTDYLSKVSDVWSRKVGRGKTVKWPANGIGQKGNSGVAGMIKQVPGSIGYVEYIYAENNNLPVAKIRNKKGNFVSPGVEGASLSANVNMPDDTRITVTDSESENGYPISSFTWIITYKEQKYNENTLENAKTLVNLLWWMTHDGQKYAEALKYAPLPEKAVQKAEKIIQSITFNGNKIWKR